MMQETLPKWAGSPGCLARRACWSCMGTHEIALGWRRIAALDYELPPEGTCPFGRDWKDIEAERAAHLAAVPGKIADSVDERWDPALRRLREQLTDEEFTIMLAELRDSGAFHVLPGRATEVAEEIARRRGIDLSQQVTG